MLDLRRSEITQQMDILPESVTKYTNRVYNKFDIHSRQELLRLTEQLEQKWLEENA